MREVKSPRAGKRNSESPMRSVTCKCRVVQATRLSKNTCWPYPIWQIADHSQIKGAPAEDPAQHHTLTVSLASHHNKVANQLTTHEFLSSGVTVAYIMRNEEDESEGSVVDPGKEDTARKEVGASKKKDNIHEA
ncbi:hypothetical protein H6P81_001891 [Aristolochia fimbriata]|uniref:Uncharacterized protein n=1 Tax=Aristolochia fimbriata TaxID=158543 RepID=A0AAV7FCR0_ARIFI|nr:hypothetical protein H6P81_001891 [Aristolochia fimbriata]